MLVFGFYLLYDISLISSSQIFQKATRYKLNKPIVFKNPIGIKNNSPQRSLFTSPKPINFIVQKLYLFFQEPPTRPQVPCHRPSSYIQQHLISNLPHILYTKTLDQYIPKQKTEEGFHLILKWGRWSRYTLGWFSSPSTVEFQTTVFSGHFTTNSIFLLT